MSHIFPENCTRETSIKMPKPARNGSGVVQPTEQKQDNYMKLFEKLYSDSKTPKTV